MLYLENESELSPDFDLHEIALQVITHVMKREGCPYETETSVLITNNDEIRKYNKSYRGIDKETDVLSFPNSDFLHPADFTEFCNQKDAEHFNPETGAFVLGDIMLSADKITEQALAYNHSVLREYAFLITHSVLHLIGYDHMDEEEAKTMEDKQNQYLEELQITRA